MQLARDVDEFRYIVVVIFELLERKKVLNIRNIAGQQVVHANDVETFPNKPVAEMRSEEARSPGNENSFHRRWILI